MQRLPWRPWVCPGRMGVEAAQLCGSRGPGSTSCAGERVPIAQGCCLYGFLQPLAALSRRVKGGGGRAARITGTLAPRAGSRGSVRALSLASAGWCAEGLPQGPLFVGSAALRPTPGRGSFPHAWHLRHLLGHSLGSLLVGCHAGIGRGGYGDAPPAHDSACDLASLAAQLCSTDIPH